MLSEKGCERKRGRERESDREAAPLESNYSLGLSSKAISPAPRRPLPLPPRRRSKLFQTNICIIRR